MWSLNKKFVNTSRGELRTCMERWERDTKPWEVSGSETMHTFVWLGPICGNSSQCRESWMAADTDTWLGSESTSLVVARRTLYGTYLHILAPSYCFPVSSYVSRSHLRSNVSYQLAALHSLIDFLQWLKVSQRMAQLYGAVCQLNVFTGLNFFRKAYTHFNLTD